ncbi:copper resistance D family protein [Nocardioides sambongensis]|uniref:copper resistance D family protein n=1 Tax=Nocardioides sambongensis TaxID=2589074 RepID=UPI0011263FFA|nr:CopD family protein [Nocardioides sambongensis]
MTTHEPTAPASEVDDPRGGPQRGPVVLAAVLAAVGALIVLLLAGGGAPQEPIPGLPDPGRVTGWGLPLSRLAADLLAVGVLAGLLVVPLTMRRPGDDLTGRALRATGAVRWLAAGWAATALVQAVLTYSDQFAVPVSRMTFREVSGFLRTVDQGQALLVQALMAAVVAVAVRWVLTSRGALVLLVLALAAVTPPLLTGHAASSGSHDTAIVAILVHVLAAVVWVGGLVALWWHLALDRSLQERAVRRFAAVATWCFALTAASGVVSAWVRIGSFDELDSAYAVGALVKVTVLGVIGLLALRVRRAVISRGPGSWRSLAAITAGEGC